MVNWKGLSSILFSGLLLPLLLLLQTGEGRKGAAWEVKAYDYRQIHEELSLIDDTAWTRKPEDMQAWDFLDTANNKGLGGHEKTANEDDDGDDEEQEQEERHPAENMLEKHHADGSLSYILSGY